MDQFFSRTYLSGFRYLRSNRPSEYRFIWIFALISLYGIVIYQTYTTLLAYSSVDTKTIIEVIRLPIDGERILQFPPISVCHTGNLNRTYVGRNLDFPPGIFERAQKLGLNQNGLINEFIRYLNLFNFFGHAGEFDEEIWQLMTEIYELNFHGDVHFSDFLSHAILRGKQIFKNCLWHGRHIPCMQTEFSMGLASCYFVFVNRSWNEIYTGGIGPENALQLDMEIDMNHVVDSWSDDQSYGIDELGVRVFTRQTPSPFDSPANFPMNTHGIVKVKFMNANLMTRCRRYSLSGNGWYDFALCMRDDYLFHLARKLCGCTPILTDTLPRNQDVCTPRLMKECVLKKVMASGVDDVANQSFAIYAKSVCPEGCFQDIFQSTYSFYSLDPRDRRDRVMRNRLTIYYETTDYLAKTERSVRDDQRMAVYLGGVWIVYTGMSAAAVVHALCLIFYYSAKMLMEKLNYAWRKIKTRYHKMRRISDDTHVIRAFQQRRFSRFPDEKAASQPSFDGSTTTVISQYE